MAAHFGRRLRKGAATTAVAAAAVAALSASQAPGMPGEDHGTQATAGASAPVPPATSDGNATGNSPYYTDLPPLNSPNPSPSPSATGTPVAQGDAEAGIPATVLDAYKKAEAELRAAKPGCNLPWQLLAAIGKVESGQARGGRVDAYGTTIGRILGPALDGHGFALIKDTDHGVYDGNTEYDQAVGPMQFIPSTWAWAGRDGNGDGKKDPNNVYDAALAAGHYLCRNGWDLSREDGLHSAILSYNNSQDYLNTVLSWLEYYRKGTHSVPDGTGSVPTRRSDDGTPRAKSPKHSKVPKTKPDPKPDPKPSTPGGGHGSPTPAPPKPPVPPKPPQTPTDTVDHLQDAGTAKLTAMAGHGFTEQIGTRAETKAGKAVAKVRIRFTITGDTDATFAGGETVATVATDAKGVALAPALQAGEKTGDFKVMATVVGRTVAGLGYTATVTERAADTLARTSDTPLTCTPGGEFADQVQVKATYKGAVADKVAATATLIKSDTDATENDKGPYFKDADGKPVRTLTGLRTDAKGLLTLPKLYADDTTGTFLLRITTTGGATLTVELKVAAADSSASPSPSPSPSAS
ncbi:lytic transglycosylase domain-containing protein [Streptomyces barringtoniae]|uniref:lytic transglycosylase domain-containing protein n=1 Tax=Streptomyces barringtoniae TaxID=2892029 RepID=UPI001E64F7FA|nr:lytic transglycosylase domain-containing protein [Streptomyces barringtoniae]MCC5478119.1 lytic transglycosylase domain-containing protein [Streptomyces barringtoniae]